MSDGCTRGSDSEKSESRLFAVMLEAVSVPENKNRMR